MNRVITIVGARPQFVKASVVSRTLKTEGVAETIIHTGQHFDENMSRIFFDEMEIPKPGYELGIHSLGHGAMTGKMMVEIEKILGEDEPDGVIVYGDTNSTLAGALSASKLNIPVAHVEAGLRSFNRDMPEEINRIATDHISDLLFCPTETAIENATREGLGLRSELVLSGDVMFDTILHFKNKAVHPSGVPTEDYILCTIHRQENTDNRERFLNLVQLLNNIAKKHVVVFPAHPRIKNMLSSVKLDNNIRIIDPVGYLEMVSLISNASLVMTDSGGLQKEAFFCKRYCLTMRDETEWVELVENGYNEIIGDDLEKAMDMVGVHYGNTIDNPLPLYGYGNASQVIARHISGNYEPLGDEKPGLPEKDLRSNLGCG